MAGVDTPYDIDLDVGTGKMYWTETGAAEQIRRVNLDGSGAELLVTNRQAICAIALYP